METLDQVVSPALPLARRRAGRGPTSALLTTYERIKSDIIAGLHAPGTPLRVKWLQQHYCVSTSTLREVLSRLAGDGLVNAEDGRGFKVAPISLSDLKDVCDLRRLIESLAVGRSLENGNEQWEAALVASYHGLSKIERRLSSDQTPNLAVEWEAKNRDFHEALVAACPSERLLRFRRILYDESARYRQLSLTVALSLRDIHAEHKAIFEAALSRDVTLARRLTDEHVDRTVTVLMETVVARLR